MEVCRFKARADATHTVASALPHIFSSSSWLLETTAAGACDEDLIAAARHGDETAFRVLVERYARATTRWASRFFVQPDVIEEITQISFAQAWRALKSYQSRGEHSFPAWLKRITINTCYDELRRAGRRKEERFDSLATGGTNTWQVYSDHTDLEQAMISRDLAKKLMARLEPEDQLMLTLLKVEGWSIAEIADHLDWTPAKVKMRVHRARRIFERARPKYC